MPLYSRPRPDRTRRLKVFTLILATTGAALSATAPAAAQDARYFSPTHAASEGSPYTSFYARTFGAGGPPEQPEAPLETSAAPPATTEADSATGNVVYVIEDGHLLTYRADDYAHGGPALSGTMVPPSSGGGAATRSAELTSITGRLYGATPPTSPPPPTAVGGPEAPRDPAAPIRLLPPQY